MPLARAVAEDGSPDRFVRTILLVEDDVLVRATVAELLRDAGYRVIEAVDAAEAKAVLNSEAESEVELVFSDIRMPNESGVALARWIRGQHPRVPVLLGSGFADAGATAEVPADVPVLQKPYDFSNVLARIAEMLRHDQPGGP